MTTETDGLNDTVEHIVSRLSEALEDLDDEIGVDPAHALMAVTALSVRFCWGMSKDTSQVRETLAILIDDYATQAEFGKMGEH